MVNMGYCKFENTYKALRQCINDWNPTSTDEQYYSKLLIDLCQQVSESYGDDEYDDEDFEEE